MVVTLLPTATAESCSQWEKALVPIVVTESGIKTLFNRAQPEKALSPMEASPSGSVTAESCEQL